MTGTRLTAIFGALMGLAACGGGGVIATGSSDPYTAMRDPCLAQAARLTGAEAGSVEVTGELQTEGGPLLTLLADGRPYSCRLEAGGRVTVFSEFAN